MSFLSQPITLQSLFGKKRLIGGIQVQVIQSEETSDVLSITKQPTQTGAPITDHSFLEPTVLRMKILQQNNNLISGLLATFKGNDLAQIYQAFLTLQASREPFTVVTPKRTYKSMLISELRQDTDKNTENILSLSVTLQQVIIVTVGVATIPASRQRSPKKTQSNQNLGRQSALLTGSQAVGINSPGFTK